MNNSTIRYIRTKKNCTQEPTKNCTKEPTKNCIHKNQQRLLGHARELAWSQVCQDKQVKRPSTTTNLTADHQPCHLYLHYSSANRRAAIRWWTNRGAQQSETLSGKRNVWGKRVIVDISPLEHKQEILASIQKKALARTLLLNDSQGSKQIFPWATQGTIVQVRRIDHKVWHLSHDPLHHWMKDQSKTKKAQRIPLLNPTTAPDGVIT